MCGRIHAQETEWQSGVRSYFIPRLPAHLVQELNDVTVCSGILYMLVPIVPKCKPLQYRYLIPAPVDRTSVSTWFYKHP